MPQAIILREPGGPSVLRAEEIAVAPPAPGELRVRQTAIGVNFHDVYVRSGLYRTLRLPGVPGIEAVGVVEAVGPAVDAFRPGDRIGYVTSSYGGYASERLLPAGLAIGLPPSLDDRTAAAALVRGLTVEILTRVVHRVGPGDRVLVHAAGSGVGRMLCQKLSHIGARVIGTAGTAEKAAAARAAGCAEVIRYRDEDFVARVREFTDGRGVAVAYDAVGKDTFAGSLACLSVRGHLVNYGQASGAVPPFEVSRLAERSNTLSRPILFHYIAEPAEREALAAGLFEALATRVLTVETARVLPLAAAAAAHEALETRQAQGPLILVP